VVAGRDRFRGIDSEAKAAGATNRKTLTAKLDILHRDIFVIVTSCRVLETRVERKDENQAAHRHHAP
jgi:hypothetical protein